MSSTSKRRRLLAVGLAALSLSAAMASSADAARRGGSFGSRGSRTYSPSGGFGGGAFGAPINRSITPRTPGTAQPGGFNRNRPFGGPQTQGQRRGGFIGPLLGGLAAGGLLGMMLGGGFGGGLGGLGGMMGGLMQILLIAGAAWLLISFLRRRRQAQPAGASAFSGPAGGAEQRFGRQEAVTPFTGGAAQGFGREPQRQGGGMFGGLGGFGGQQQQGFGQPQSQGGGGDELNLGRGEVDGLERTFLEVQEAYGREDYAGIRERSTPEVMSFMSEEMGRNASEGRKNEMRDFRVLSRDLTESWRDETGDYATLAIRFTALDWWTDRRTSEVVEGSPTEPTTTTEFWTFTRQPGAFGGGGWKVSAVQEEGR